ncbi:MAG: penicillin-binding protein 2 [Solirubrobacterales bacterium]
MFLRNEDLPRGSRLSLRIAVLGGFAVALFAVLFFRLWNLQVIDGSHYLAEAQNNRTREFRVLAPRGEILARNGEPIVQNRTSLALLLNTSKLPAAKAKADAELARLGSLAHMSLKRVREVIAEEEKVAAGAPVTLRRDVGHDLVYYLEENKRSFPGVSVERVFVRAYPNESEAAHVVGTVGEVTEEQLAKKRYSRLEPGEEVGQSGAEYAYDRFLRGVPGRTRVQVNAMGEPTPGGQLVQVAPTPGKDLVLTINQAVQRAGEAALAERGLPGAFISMNVHSGEILALGSFPSYDPKVFTEPMTQSQVNELFRDPILAPLTDRATESAYPTGSTYKVLTALAALENGVITPATTIVDNGYIERATQKFENAGGTAYGALSLVRALEVSSDVFMYELGGRMWDKPYLQEWSHRMGIGDPSGLDIPGESEGLVPSRNWRDQLFKEGNTDRPWSEGDNIQLATGQGDLQTTPLQMAIAYAALGNGGTIVTPHVGKEVRDAAGRVLKEFDPGPRRHVKLDPDSRQAILEGLHGAAQGPEGTAAGIFGGFPIPIAGKTGTAERPGHADQSWFIALAPYPNPNIVTAVTIEEGGFGAESAAPAVLQMLEAYFGKQASEITTSGGTE